MSATFSGAEGRMLRAGGQNGELKMDDESIYVEMKDVLRAKSKDDAIAAIENALYEQDFNLPLSAPNGGRTVIKSVAVTEIKKTAEQITARAAAMPPAPGMFSMM